MSAAPAVTGASRSCPHPQKIALHGKWRNYSMSGIKGVEIHRATTGASAYSDSSYAEYDQGGAYYRFTIVETV